MTEYIDREKAENAINLHRCDTSRIEEAILHIPSADVVEREKIDKAIEEMESVYINLDYYENRLSASYWIRKSIEILKRNIEKEE